MKRMTLVALQEDEERIMQALQTLAAIQVIETDEAQPGGPSLADAEGTVLQLNNALNLLKPYAKNPSMLTAKPELTVAEAKSGLQEALSVSGEIEAADRKKVALRSKIEKNQSQIEMLLPWAGLPVRLDEVRGTKSTALFAGMLRAEDSARLSELPEHAAVQQLGGEKEIAVLVLCPKEEQSEVSTLLKGLNWTDVNLPELPHTAAEAIRQNEAAIRELEGQVGEMEQQLGALGVNRALIAASADAAAIERDRAQAKALLQQTDAAFAMEAWVRSDMEQQVQEAVAGITDAFFLEIREPAEEEFPQQPSVVHNTPLVTPYESVTNLYSRPAPGSIDGTPLMAPWYFLLFGMMLGDTGYGVVLALGALWFVKKVKPVGMMGGIAKVVMWGGVSTIFWGPLIGTFFGMDWNAFLGTEGVFPLLVDPNKDPMTMLLLCFGLGLAHIFCGVGIKMYMSFRDGDWKTAIFDNFSWFLIVFGLIIFAALPALSMVGVVMAITGALMVLLFKGRDKPKVISRAVSGLAGLYDVTSYLSDVLSYARLFALGIATGVIGSVFNQLVGMIMGGGSFWLVQGILYIVGALLLAALHTFNLAINTLGTFIHCARLQYVEFYGKFYEVGGKEFKPLGYKTRFTKVRPT